MNDWIPSQVGIRDHPKTRRLTRSLGVSVPQIVGHLHCLWWWVLDYAPDGDLEDFEPEDIADGAGWESDAETFVDALLNCGPKGRAGYLERLDGRLVVHDWEDNQGAQFRSRILAAQRKRAQRERDKEVPEQDTDGTESPECPSGVTGECDNVTDHGDLARAKDLTGPDRTRPKEEEDREYAGLLPVENLSDEEKTALNRLRAVAKYPFDYGKDLAHLRQLVLDYPEVDVLNEVAGWCAWVLDKPLSANSKPRSQLRTRCIKAIEFGHVKALPPPTREFRVAPPPLSAEEEATRQAEQAENAKRAHEQVARLGVDVRRQAIAGGVP